MPVPVLDGRALDPAAFGALCASLLAEGLSVRFVASGTSMAPGIRSGEAVTVEPPTREPLRAGEVVLYRRADGALALHRVLRVRVHCGRRLCLLGGDAPRARCEEVGLESVLGRWVPLSRPGGRAAARARALRLRAALAWRSLAARLARRLR